MPATWNGSVSAADSTSSLSATTSIRPVGSAGLMFSSVRAMTLPDTLMTLSSLTASAALNALEFGREHALRDAVVIAQVDEQQMAVIALAMDPAGQRTACPTCSGPKRVARVRAVAAC